MLVSSLDIKKAITTKPAAAELLPWPEVGTLETLHGFRNRER